MVENEVIILSFNQTNPKHPTKITMKKLLAQTTYFFKSIYSFMYCKAGKPRYMPQEEYIEKIINKEGVNLKKMHTLVWNTRNIVIDNYWKRANYCWAFQIASFTGYFAVSGSAVDQKSPEILYFVICIGFVTSIAWLLTNIGSRSSQKHWELHLDMLEDHVTGPLNKTRTTDEALSITKINEIVSGYIIFIWLMLAVRYLCAHIAFTHKTEFDFQVFFSSVITIYFSIAMRVGYGRKKFKSEQWKVYERDAH